MAMDLKNSKLLEELAPLKPYFISAGVFSLFINMLMIVPAFYMLQVYDRAVGSRSESTLLMLTMIMVFLLASMGGLEWVRTQLLVRTGARMDQLLGDKLFDASFQQALYTGGQQASAQPLSDLHSLRQFITGPGLFAAFDTPWVPIYVGLMWLFHPWFGILAILSILTLLTINITSHIMTNKLLTEAQGEATKSSGQTTRNLRNAEVVESMGMMGNMLRRWRASNDSVIAKQGVASDKAGALTATSKSLRQILQSSALGMGAYLAINGEISPGLMIAGSILLGRALAPIDQLIGSWKGFIAAREQFIRIDDLLKRVADNPERLELPAPTGAVTVENVTAVPPGSKEAVLKGINFSLAAGESLAVIGPSAAGKSSLARAILGIWPVAGAVRLDSADVWKWDRDLLGPHIGYLPQDVELFDGTISENIARFGDIDSKQIVEAAQMAGVHDLVLRLPEGYDTVIGATGGVLSGGQRQRIGLARAIYGEPKLVILDEPNSNLDDQGEAALRETVLQLKRQGTTVIIISHRPSILSAVDKLLILRDGTMVDFGPAADVLGKLQKARAQLQSQAPAANPAAGVQTVAIP
jgi:ATP-binding cassette subfamily C protein EexD